MTWTKKKDSAEARDFWNHVETVAQKVRKSEIYANFRMPSPVGSGQCADLSEEYEEGQQEPRRELKRA